MKRDAGSLEQRTGTDLEKDLELQNWNRELEKRKTRSYRHKKNQQRNEEQDYNSMCVSYSVTFPTRHFLRSLLQAGANDLNAGRSFSELTQKSVEKNI